MASPGSLFSKDLLEALYTKPYTGIISYLSPHDCLTVQDFNRSALASSHWLDVPLTKDGRKVSKKRDPNHVFKTFARLDDEEDHDLVRQNMIKTITSEFNWYSDLALICLQMHKISLSEWIGKMQNPKHPADELAVYVLSRMYGKHSLIYTKTKTWSTIGTSNPMEEKKVYQLCEFKFVNMGKNNLIELIRKPSSLMPLVSSVPLQSTYDSGYYETLSSEIKTEPLDPSDQPDPQEDLKETAQTPPGVTVK